MRLLFHGAIYGSKWYILFVCHWKCLCKSLENKAKSFFKRFFYRILFTQNFTFTQSQLGKGGVCLNVCRNKKKKQTMNKTKVDFFSVDNQNIDNHLYLLILCHSYEHVIGAYRHFDFVSIFRNKYYFCLASSIKMVKNYSVKILMWYLS